MDQNLDYLCVCLVSAALQQLSVLDSLSRKVDGLKCSLERIISNSSAAGPCCPVDWTQFNSDCYLFSHQTLSWNGAKNWCERKNAHLVILHTNEEWDFVTRNSVPHLYWVGLTDGRTGKWEWVNQTPYSMERRRWVPGQPDAWTGHGLGPEDEDCAHLHKDGRLNDMHCSISVPRFRRWLYPGLGVSFVLIFIIAVGVTNTNTLRRLWAVEKTVSNQTERLTSTLQLTKVSEGLKQLSALDTIGRTVAKLKCTLERYMNNGSVSIGCCPLGWESFSTSCYFFSRTALKVGVGQSDAVCHEPQVKHLTDLRWKPGQPDSWTGHGLGAGDEDCAHIHNDGRLNDLHCSTRLRYICQRHSQRS
ncbi:hypothetical protein XENOCAPTIV_028525 [Xenoophorus captivus]|uniref:C-type lectin domain-containing protein n=1 Tax=Xenoophorus captivus TaxID=1517983 RepID=A0ABV0RWM9_9TELE